jgi:hypothetical protein
MLTDDSAYLSFICMLSGIEALAGFRFVEQPESGKRFNEFVAKYLPAEYHPYAANGTLWRFRCRLVHSFSPAGFTLTHHHSENHLRIDAGTGNPVLNAEDFYAALLVASQAYFRELRQSAELQRLFTIRLDDKHKGGTVSLGPLRLQAPSTSSGATTL